METLNSINVKITKHPILGRGTTKDPFRLDYRTLQAGETWVYNGNGGFEPGSGGGAGAASNGLSIDDDEIVLGGTLSQNTEIASAGNSLSFTGNARMYIGDNEGNAYAGVSQAPKLYITRTGSHTLHQPTFGIKDTLSYVDNNATIFEYNFATPTGEFAPWSSFVGLVENAGGSGEDNLVYIEGWNASPTGRIRTDQPAMYMHFENQYEVSAHGFCMEYILSTTAIDGTNSRFWYYIANRDDLSNTSSFWEANQYEWRNSDTSTATLSLGKSGSMSLYGTDNSLLTFESVADGSIFLRHRNAADTGYLSIMSANALGIYLGASDFDFYMNDSNLNFLGTSIASFKNAGDNEDRMTISGNYGTGEFRHWAGGGGYFQTFYANNVEAMRIVNDSSKTSVMIGQPSYDASAVLNVASTTTGFLPPRMTEAQRLAISSPATGLIVYQTNNTEGVYVKKAAGWALVTAV